MRLLLQYQPASLPAPAVTHWSPHALKAGGRGPMHCSRREYSSCSDFLRAYSSPDALTARALSAANMAMARVLLLLALVACAQVSTAILLWRIPSRAIRAYCGV